MDKHASFAPVHEHLPVIVYETLLKTLKTVSLVSLIAHKVSQSYQGAPLFYWLKSGLKTLISIYQHDPTSHLPTLFNIEQRCSPTDTRSTLNSVLARWSLPCGEAHITINLSQDRTRPHWENPLLPLGMRGHRSSSNVRCQRTMSPGSAEEMACTVSQTTSDGTKHSPSQLRKLSLSRRQTQEDRSSMYCPTSASWQKPMLGK